MSDYFAAYSKRLERNEKALLKLADEIISADETVEVYVNSDFLTANRRLQGITVIKEEYINSIHFHEVPYSWSGCQYPEFPEGKRSFGEDENCSMPFTVLQVFSTFKPITSIKFKQPNDFFKSKEQYLKSYSFLSRYQSKI